MSKRIYLDRDEFHQEMTNCKRNDALSKLAIEMLSTLCKEVSRKYYFEFEEDYEDAAAYAMYDVLKYWRGFKENPVVQLEIVRNFIHGEYFNIHIDAFNTIKVVAIQNGILDEIPKEDGVLFFSIGETANKSLTNMATVLRTDHLGIYLDRVKCKITFMDNYNKSPDYDSYNSFLQFSPLLAGETFAYGENGKNIIETIDVDGKKTKIKKKIMDLVPISCSKFHMKPNIYTFKKPPNSFSYFSSMSTNGCLKFIDKRNPKLLRNGNLLTMSNSGSDSAFFNI